MDQLQSLRAAVVARRDDQVDLLNRLRAAAPEEYGYRTQGAFLMAQVARAAEIGEMERFISQLDEAIELETGDRVRVYCSPTLQTMGCD